MRERKKKVMILGFDCAMPRMIKKHVDEGILPNFKKIIDAGVFSEQCLVPYPTVTPPNWTSIATGAWPGTHDITDFYYYNDTKPIDNSSIFQSFSSSRCKAEYLWEAADKAGKQCIVLNYPTSWPSKMKNGMIIGGVGLSIGEFRDALPNLDHQFSLSGDHMVTTGFYPGALRGEFIKADGWTGVTTMGTSPLEMKLDLSFPNARVKPAPTTWWILARDLHGDGYDTITLSPTKSFDDAFCTLTVGEWSNRIESNINFNDRTSHKVFFKCKLLELSEDAEDFRFIIGAMLGSNFEAKPKELAEELLNIKSNGCFHEAGGMIMSMLNMIDATTYAEMNENMSEWLGDAAVHLLKNKNWDLFAMHSHPIDWMYHAMFEKLESTDPKEREEAWNVHRRVYQSEDRLLGKVLNAIDKDTILIVASDHGATADGPMFDPYEALSAAGLSVLDKVPPKKASGGEGDFGEFWVDRENPFFRYSPNISKSMALPQRELYVYINLKGRNPGGIVEQKDYEKVQKKIIDALLTYVDPQTGKRPISMALSRQDAAILGLTGTSNQLGDVVYALDPSYSAQHGPLLPNATFKEFGDLRGLLIFYGPGFKKGHKMLRRCSLPDIAPTICHLTDLPRPAQVEGAVLYDALDED